MKFLQFKYHILLLFLLLFDNIIIAQCKIEQRIKTNRTYYCSNQINLGLELNGNTNTIINASLSLEEKKFSILFYSTHPNLVQCKQDEIITINLNDNSAIYLKNFHESSTNSLTGNSKRNWTLNNEAIIYKYQLFKIQDLGIKSIILANSQWKISKKANKQLAETIACLLDLSKTKNK